MIATRSRQRDFPAEARQATEWAESKARPSTPRPRFRGTLRLPNRRRSGGNQTRSNPIRARPAMHPDRNARGPRQARNPPNTPNSRSVGAGRWGAGLLPASVFSKVFPCIPRPALLHTSKVHKIINQRAYYFLGSTPLFWRLVRDGSPRWSSSRLLRRSLTTGVIVLLSN